MHVREALARVLEMMRRGAWEDALTALHHLLNVRMDDSTLLFLIASCHRMMGHDGLAYGLFRRAIEMDGENYEAIHNLCSILQEMGRHDEEVELLENCRKMRPEDMSIVHNLASAHLQTRKPEIAEKYARESLELEGDRPDTWIVLSLALLEQERFGEGFDAWDKALTIGERKTRNFWALGQTPMWDGTPGQNVMVYSEQGHGDVLMFASSMNEVIARSEQVFIDTCQWNMVELLQRSFPETIVFCTPDSQIRNYHEELNIDAAIPFGSLPTLFRRKPSDFPRHDGYIRACPSKRREMRRRLDDLGEGLKIGLAWRGGIKATHSVNRQIPLDQFAPILQQDGAHFISVNYFADAGGEAILQEDITDVPVHHWQAAIDNFDMLTALIDELDLLISVPQTAVHQRASLGKECWILTSHRPPWAFGMDRDDMIWYPKQTRQFRQLEGEEDYRPAIQRCAEALSKVTGSKPGTFIPPIAPTEKFKLGPLQC